MIKASRKNNLIALFIVAGFYLVYFFAAPKAYDGNDDVCIQQVLSGMITGRPYPIHPYIHAFISAPISQLYRLFPQIPWWYLWSTLILVLGLYLVHYYLLSQIEKGTDSIAFSIGVFALFDYGISFFCISRMNFSIVPAFLGTGCIAAVLSMDKIEQSKRHFIGILSFIGFAIVVCHRWETGVAVSGYYALSWGYYFYKTSNSNPRFLKKSIILTTGILLTCILLISSNAMIQRQVNGLDYQTFYRARSQYLDYPHPDYSENEEAYKELGWDKDVAALVDYWCFMDEHVTAESLKKLSGTDYLEVSFISEVLEQALQNKEIRLLIKVWMSSCLIWACSSFMKYHKSKLWVGILNLMGTLALFCYLLIKGRVIYRALAPFLIVSFVTFIFLSFEVEREYSEKDRIILGILISAAVLMILPGASRLNFDETWARETIEKKEKEAIINSYVAEHPSEMYISDLEHQLLQINPILTYRDQQTVNLISWGNVLTHSDLEKKQLSKLGLGTEVRGELLLAENVHLLSSINLRTKERINPYGRLGAFYQWMRDRYGAIGLFQMDEISKDFCVYHFVFSDTREAYSEYYIFDDEWEPILVDCNSK